MLIYNQTLNIFEERMGLFISFFLFRPMKYLPVLADHFPMQFDDSQDDQLMQYHDLQLKLLRQHH